MTSAKNATAFRQYKSGDRLVAGLVLAVIAFWLFAQTTFNVLPSMQADLQFDDGISDIAVSITALFSGIFIVVAGGLADRSGRLHYAGHARADEGLSRRCTTQRALSCWSIGSWGGGGLCALLVGVVDSTMGWRAIFWMSTAVALVRRMLFWGTPESRAEFDGENRPLGRVFAFSIAAVAFNVIVNKGAALGWLNPAVLTLGAGCAAAFGALVWTARRCRHPFVDFRLFQNPIYLALTLSNFFLNRVAGSLLIVSLLVQQTDGLSSLQSGLMATGYVVAILATRRSPSLH